MAKKNKKTIKKLKNKLKKGNLSESQFNKIIEKIKAAGGKVNPANFPAPGQAGTGGGGKKKDIKQLKQKLKQGNLSSEEFNSIVEQIKNLGGKVKPSNFPPPGKTTLPNKTSEEIFGQSQSEITDLAKTDLEQASQFADDLIKKFLPDISAIGGLLDTSRSPENQELLDSLKQQADAFEKRALEGLSPEERQALREEALGSLRSNIATFQRQLARTPGAAGVRGGALAALAAQQARQLQASTRGVERNLNQQDLALQSQFGGLANIARQNQTAGLGQVRAEELSRQLFNANQQRLFTGAQIGLHQTGSGQFLGALGALRGSALGREGIDAAREGARLEADAFAKSLELAQKFQQQQLAAQQEALNQALLTSGQTPINTINQFNQIKPLLPQPGQSNVFGSSQSVDGQNVFFPNPNLFAGFPFPALGQENENFIVTPDGGIIFK